MIPLHHSEIGGGRVERPFTMGGKKLPRGTVLTREQVLSIRAQNRTSLIDRQYLRVWPKEATAAYQAPAGAKRFVVNGGFGRYDVVEGVKLNEQKLDKASAYLLAGIELPGNGEDKSN